MLNTLLQGHEKEGRTTHCQHSQGSRTPGVHAVVVMKGAFISIVNAIQGGSAARVMVERLLTLS